MAAQSSGELYVERVVTGRTGVALRMGVTVESSGMYDTCL
jgi:hypothetical protein